MKHQERIKQHVEKLASATYVPGNIGGWQKRAADAFRYASNKRNSPATPIVQFIHAAADYADNHHARFESGIGEDGVLGDYWADILRSVRGLLNGECGELDCGSTDGLILSMLKAEGFDE